MKVFNNLIIKIALVILVSYAFNDSTAQNRTELEIKYNKENGVSQIVERNSESVNVVQSTNNILRSLTISYDGSYYAVIMVNHEINYPDKYPSPEFNRKLIVYDENHETVMEILNVFRYTWSPTESKLAVIIGEDIEPGFRSKETYVYNVLDQTKFEIPVIAYDVVWAMHDNKIYTMNFAEGVYVFEPRSNTLQKTSYTGIYFSPDGKYYFEPIYDGAFFAVRKTSNNEKEETHPLLKEEYLQPYGWLLQTNCLVSRQHPHDHSFIINVENGQSEIINKEPARGGGNGLIPLDFLGARKAEILQSLDVNIPETD